MTTKQQPKPEDLIPLKQVPAACGVTEMTVFNWRMGTTRKKLPCVLKRAGSRHRVFVKRGVLEKWAAQQGIKLNQKELRVSA